MSTEPKEPTDAEIEQFLKEHAEEQKSWPASAQAAIADLNALSTVSFRRQLEAHAEIARLQAALAGLTPEAIHNFCHDLSERVCRGVHAISGEAL